MSGARLALLSATKRKKDDAEFTEKARAKMRRRPDLFEPLDRAFAEARASIMERLEEQATKTGQFNSAICEPDSKADSPDPVHRLFFQLRAIVQEISYDDLAVHIRGALGDDIRVVYPKTEPRLLTFSWGPKVAKK
jgi:hypothetical protein